MQRYTKILIFLYSCRNFFRASRFSFLTTDNILNSVVCFFIRCLCDDCLSTFMRGVGCHFGLCMTKIVKSFSSFPSYQDKSCRIILSKWTISTICCHGSEKVIFFDRRVGQSRRFVVMVLRKLSFLTDGFDNLKKANWRNALSIVPMCWKKCRVLVILSKT